MPFVRTSLCHSFAKMKHEPDLRTCYLSECYILLGIHITHQYVHLLGISNFKSLRKFPVLDAQSNRPQFPEQNDNWSCTNQVQHKNTLPFLNRSIWYQEPKHSSKKSLHPLLASNYTSIYLQTKEKKLRHRVVNTVLLGLHNTFHSQSSFTVQNFPHSSKGLTPNTTSCPQR